MAPKTGYYLKLKKFCLEQGADLFGVADISGLKDDFLLKRETLAKCDKAICIGARLSPGILSEVVDAPTRLYSYHYRMVNLLLDQIALKLANLIQKQGYFAIPIPSSQIIDWEKQSAHVSHKKLGVLAGLGWIGRNNLLVNKDYGSQLRLVTVLTDMPMKTDSSGKDRCEPCRICVKMCPAGAIREDVLGFDPVRCLEKLKEFNRRKIVEQYICGVCVNVCKGKPR
jgi:epoxyqueuosine reductase QueG